MRKMMEQAGNSHLLTILLYPKTGHMIEPPYAPHTLTSHFKDIVRRKTCRFTSKPLAVDRD